MFRFTIRDVLWLMVVVAVSCGWYIEHRRKSAERIEYRYAWAGLRQSIDREAEKIGYKVHGLPGYGVELVPRVTPPASTDNRP